jgi:hypothetical protein
MRFLKSRFHVIWAPAFDLQSSLCLEKVVFEWIRKRLVQAYADCDVSYQAIATMS